MSDNQTTTAAGRQEWTPEPWIAEGNASYWEVRSADWEFGGIGDTCASSASAPEYGRSMALGEANASRIVACVNALKGISDPAAFVSAVRAVEETLTKIAEEHEEQARAWGGEEGDIDNSEYHAKWGKVARASLSTLRAELTKLEATKPSGDA